MTCFFQTTLTFQPTLEKTSFSTPLLRRQLRLLMNARVHRPNFDMCLYHVFLLADQIYFPSISHSLQFLDHSELQITNVGHKEKPEVYTSIPVPFSTPQSFSLPYVNFLQVGDSDFLFASIIREGLNNQLLKLERTDRNYRRKSKRSRRSMMMRIWAITP